MKPISQLPLFKKLTKDYPTKDIPFLSRQKNRFLDTQPYTGLKVILNLPITIENLINIDVLQSSGCDLYVHLFSFVPINPQAIECIKQAKIPILKNKQAPNTGVDVILDCSAELIHIKPRIGVSEITESGVAIYKATKPTYPVVSVNESKIKLLECSLGTGEAFIRAIKKLALKNITNKSFVVFGFGRVGKGIVNALLPHTSHITIVDIDIDTLQQIKKYKLKAIDATDYKAVEKAIAKSDIVVTATGIKDIMSLSIPTVSKQFNKSSYAPSPPITDLPMKFNVYSKEKYLLT